MVEPGSSLSSVYFCIMKVVVALLVLCVAAINGAGGQSFFGSEPSDDYYRRNDVFDCPSRYYPPVPFLNAFSADNAPAVAGGVRAFDGEYQHMVAIGWEFNDGIKYLCGGSIIHSKFILTAAHCSLPVNGISPTTIRAGDTDLSSEENDYLAQQRTILRIVRHSLHRHSRSYNDIALIELEQDLLFNLQVSSACIWLETYIPSEPLQIVGFGEMKLADGPSMTLQRGHVDHHPIDDCDKRLTTRRRIPDGLLESQFCASHETMDTCQGDSGGPIEVRKIDMFSREIALIVGITSFGTACGSGSIGVYTKISPYVEWIETTTNQSFSYEKCASRIEFSEFKPHGIIELTSDKSLPYFHLLRNRSNNQEFDCIGTLIDDQFVVTSALCATHKAGAPKFIYIADHEEYVEIAEWIPHPQYQKDTQANNIALLRLSKFLKRGLKPTCLATQEQSKENLAVSFMLNSFVTENGLRKFAYFKRTFWPEDKQCSANLNEICKRSTLPVIPTICKVTNGAPILKDSPEGIPLLYGIIDAEGSKCDGELRGTLIEPYMKWIRSVLQEYLRKEVLIFV